MTAQKSPYALFGIECGPGWGALYWPLIELCEKDGVEILQIKEKFGMLRFYVGKAPQHVRQAIDEAERKSVQTCEHCGAPGRRVSDGYILTLCADCESKWR